MKALRNHGIGIFAKLSTVQFDPSAFYARNLSGAFDPTIAGFVRLTSLRVPWNDPPQGGGYAPGFGGGVAPDFSYPFYYDQSTEVAAQENGTVPAACSLTASAGNTLTFHDAPADGCMPGGLRTGTAICQDPVLAPNATAEPNGSFGGYLTHLAGVNSDGTATDLGIGFTWTSNYNGSTGGVSIKKTDLPADGNGTGGVTITSVTEISTYQGITVTGVNGGKIGAAATLSSGKACNGLFTGKFDGNVTVSASQTCTFINGFITGNVQTDGGNLELSGVLIGGNVQINGSGMFSIGPSTVINGNLQIENIRAGTAQNQVCGSKVYGNLQFQNNGTSVLIGAADETLCIGNVIGGNLQVQNNAAATSIFGNTVGGNLQDQNNTASSQVFSNAVTGLLQCQNDAMIEGGMNTARLKQGQCIGF